MIHRTILEIGLSKLTFLCAKSSNHSTCRTAGYFRGVLVFIIFVVHPGVMKFSTHEIFHTKFSTHCSAVNTYSNWICDVLLWLFFATCSALGPQGPLSQAVLRVRADEVNRGSTTKRKRAQYLSFNAEEPKVTSSANESAQLPFLRWRSSYSPVLASKCFCRRGTQPSPLTATHEVIVPLT